MINEVIKQNMKVAVQALEKEDLGLVNIVGNRIVTDLMIVEDKRWMLAGFILKEVSNEINLINQINKNSFNESKKIGKETLKELNSLLEQKEAQPEDLWDLIKNYEKKIRKHLISEVELSIYKENPDFVKKTRRMLVDYLYKNKNLLIIKNNRLIDGVSSEISLKINLQGFHLDDLIFYFVMKVFGHYYDFAMFEYLSLEKEDEKKLIEEEIYSYIERIYNLFKGQLDVDSMKKESLTIIGDLGAKWRKLIINYGDVFTFKKERKEIELSPEVKDTIGKVIAEGMKKELKNKKKGSK